MSYSLLISCAFASCFSACVAESVGSEGAGAGVVDEAAEGSFCRRAFSGLDTTAAGVALLRAAGFVILAIELRCPAAADWCCAA